MAEPLRPLRGRLRDEAQRLHVPIDVVERDYALGHVLAATYERDALNAALVFKGGTALKKAYFGDGDAPLLLPGGDRRREAPHDAPG